MPQCECCRMLPRVGPKHPRCRCRRLPGGEAEPGPFVPCVEVILRFGLERGLRPPFVRRRAGKHVIEEGRGRGDAVSCEFLARVSKTFLSGDAGRDRGACKEARPQSMATGSRSVRQAVISEPVYVGAALDRCCAWPVGESRIVSTGSWLSPSKQTPIRSVAVIPQPNPAWRRGSPASSPQERKVRVKLLMFANDRDTRLSGFSPRLCPLFAPRSIGVSRRSLKADWGPGLPNAKRIRLARQVMPWTAWNMVSQFVNVFAEDWRLAQQSAAND